MASEHAVKEASLAIANSYDKRGGTEVLRLNSCPRCKKGDVGADRDQYGWYEYCIQCGYMRDLIDVVEPGQQQTGGLKEHRRGVKVTGKGK